MHLQICNIVYINNVISARIPTEDELTAQRNLAENVYDLKLTFDNEAIVRTAKLGLIQGLSPDSEGATRCLAPAEGSVWNKVKYRAVLPIPYGTTSFTVNGVEHDTGLDGAQGWYALSPIESGESITLSCFADGVSYAASILGGRSGMFLIIK